MAGNCGNSCEQLRTNVNERKQLMWVNSHVWIAKYSNELSFDRLVSIRMIVKQCNHHSIETLALIYMKWYYTSALCWCCFCCRGRRVKTTLLGCLKSIWQDQILIKYEISNVWTIYSTWTTKASEYWTSQITTL